MDRASRNVYLKQYRKTHSSQLSKYFKEYRKTNRDKMRGIQKRYRNSHRESTNTYNRERMRKWRGDHPIVSRRRNLKWKSSHREQLKESARDYGRRLRISAIQKIAGTDHPTCRNCGCDDIRVLEINHINGGGTQETKHLGAGVNFYRLIVNGKRSVNDLNILCKICNALDFIQRTYSVGSRYSIRWN
jgi:hypothetical protein